MNYQRRILGISMASIMLLTLFAVCATTSVSAVPAATNIGPAVAPWKEGTSTGFDLLYVGASDGRLYLREWKDGSSTSAGSWSPSNAINGWTKARPAVLCRSSSSYLIELFHTGTDGAIYYKASNVVDWTQSGSWTRVVSAGWADPTIGPTVVEWKTSSGSGFDMFYVHASDHKIWGMRYYDATSTQAAHWGQAYSINGWTLATLDAISIPGVSTEVFHTGTDGAVYHMTAVTTTSTNNVPYQLQAASWTRVTPTGSTNPNIGPAADGFSTGYDLFYVRASDHQICWNRWYYTGVPDAGHWSGMTPLNGWTLASPAAMMRFSGDVELLHTGTDGATYYKHGTDAQSLGSGGWAKVPT